MSSAAPTGGFSSYESSAVAIGSRLYQGQGTNIGAADYASVGQLTTAFSPAPLGVSPSSLAVSSTHMFASAGTTIYRFPIPTDSSPITKT